MDNNRMSTADMIQYCNEALAWDDFGPIDIFFFESVKKILLGQCSVFEAPEEQIDDLMGIERPVRDVELEPDYPMYADIYYGEEGEDEIPNYSQLAEDEAFSDALFNDGFFVDDEDNIENESVSETEAGEDSEDSDNTEDSGNDSADSSVSDTTSDEEASSEENDNSAGKPLHEEGSFTVKI